MKKRRRTLLLYSDKPERRQLLQFSIGHRPAPDVGPISYREASTFDELLRLCDTEQIDLLVLDGEAQPTGGMGISRQLHSERDDTPPIAILIARAADAWLATWAHADAVLREPLDPIGTADTIAELLREEETSTKLSV